MGDLEGRERDAVLAALPPTVHDSAFRGGVASAIVERGPRVLDVAVRLNEPPRAWLRPLPTDDRETLATLMELLERRRGQLAHELSGPATGVIAALETVIDYEAIPDSSRGLLSEARAGMLRLTRLADDRSGMLAGEANLVAEPLGQLLACGVARVRETVDPIGDRLDVEIRACPAEAVRCDATLVDGALSVLLGNAWRFRRGQRVHAVVECWVAGGILHLSVEDDGRGADDETLAEAGTLGASTRANGVGLGLFSLRWTARRCGGAVVLQPSASGGLRATVFLPLNTPPTEAAPHG